MVFFGDMLKEKIVSIGEDPYLLVKYKENSQDMVFITKPGAQDTQQGDSKRSAELVDLTREGRGARIKSERFSVCW
jgi:hypothetical protein